MKPFTKSDRAHTVLLLRCAADVAVTGNHILGPGWSTAARLRLGKHVKRVCELATHAARHVARKTGRDPDTANNLDEYLAVVLEAAIILEERSWP